MQDLCRGASSLLYQLLAAVDVVGDSGDRCIHHKVDGERGDVVRPNHPPDRQRCSELLATRVQPIAEQRCRQRRVDEAGRDQVDADGGELKRERFGQRRYRGAERRDERARGGPPTARSADEQERSARAHFAGGEAGDVERQPEFLLDVAPRLGEVDVRQSCVVGAAGGDHNVVDRLPQLVEEAPEAVEIGGVERLTAQRADFARGLLDAVRVAAGENDLGALEPRSLSRFKTDPRAAAEQNDRLPGKLRLAAHGLPAEAGKPQPPRSFFDRMREHTPPKTATS